MLLARLTRLPWQLTCLLLAARATADISPSNTSTARPNLTPATLPLAHVEATDRVVGDLIPLTQQAVNSVKGSLYNTNFSSVANISDDSIAYISCNPSDYTGFDNAQTVFEQAYQQANISAVILYSTATDFCDYKQPNSQEMMQQFAVYSMTHKDDSAFVLRAIETLPPHRKYVVRVQGQSGNDNVGGDQDQSSQQTQNPLGPSPSTAVAMIILYSITGIITALFLVIIVTGAVRAHRHPERYGPRNVLGRPRQSRARGLGRAILDTIPIVKFGEKEEPAKPADVELGSTVETRDVNGANATNDEHATTATQPGQAPSAAAEHATETRHEATPAETEEGISPAQPAGAAAPTSTDTTSNEESLVCSICTEDFEKGQDLRVLPCNHKFHPECVDPWLLNVSGTCPLCRVDLRPVESRDSSASQEGELAPPLNPEAETSHRRRHALRDILSFRHLPNASAEERIGALRRLREQRRNQSGDLGPESANASAENVANARDRRSRRISSRLSDVFTARARRDRSDTSPAAHQRETETPDGADPNSSTGGPTSSNTHAQS